MQPDHDDIDDQNLEEATNTPESNEPEGDFIRWEAYDHPPQDRPTSWFIWLGVLAAVFLTISILVIKSWSFSLVIAAAAAALVVYAKRPPQTVSYTLSNKGLHVDDELLPFSGYKSFGVKRDEGRTSFVLLPTKRFMPGLSADFPEDMGEQIVDMLAARLPMQEIKPDMVDSLIRKLRL